MKISIITPTFNSAATLRACIESVAVQTLPAYEHIFIDGVSTDETLRLLEDAGRTHANIRVLSGKDTGVYDAMNKGIEQARGDYVYFLGSDDRLHAPTVLAEMFGAMGAPGEAVLYGDVEVAGGGMVNAAAGTRYGGVFTFEKLLARNICHQAIFYPRTLIEKVGRYNTDYRIAADWDYNLRAFKVARFEYRPLVIAAYNATGLSSTGDDLEFTYRFGDELRGIFGGSIFSPRFRAAYATLGAAGFMRLRERSLVSGLSYLLAACVHSPGYLIEVLKTATRFLRRPHAAGS